jgi:CheY-like chemotaxis protein
MELVQPILPPVDILLVDDQPRNLITLSAILENPEYNLVEARTGAEALRLLNEQEFAVVLLDVMMPEMDGFDCAGRIRKNPKAHRTPIIFVTAVANDINFIFRGYSSGAVDYITKPLEPGVVKAKVAVFAELFRARQMLKTQLLETRSLCERLEREVAQGQRDREDIADQLRTMLQALEGEFTHSGWPRRLDAKS